MLCIDFLAAPLMEQQQQQAATWHNLTIPDRSIDRTRNNTSSTRMQQMQIVSDSCSLNTTDLLVWFSLKTHVKYCQVMSNDVKCIKHIQAPSSAKLSNNKGEHVIYG